MLSLRQSFVGTHTHWASPWWELTIQTFDNNTVTTIRILNLSGGNANVTVRFNRSDGVQSHAISRVIPPRAMEMVEPEVRGGGWVEIVSDRPVAPSGFISTDRRSPHVQAPQTVAYPMVFIPIFD